MSLTNLNSFIDHWWDLFQSISGCLLPIHGPQEGSVAIFWPYFGIWVIFLILCEWIILLNILDSIEGILFWMNISDFVLNWIIFGPDSMKISIFKTDRPGPSLNEIKSAVMTLSLSPPIQSTICPFLHARCRHDAVIFTTIR